MSSDSLFELLLESCSNFPSNKFYKDNNGNECDYCEFLRLVLKEKLHLMTLGTRSGDIIFISSSDPFSLLQIVFASWSLECVVAIIDPLMKKKDINKLINTIGPALSYLDGVYEVYDSKKKKNLQSGTCVITFTTGTSNKPKGVVHSHQSILANATLVSKKLGISINDRCLNIKPLHHISSISSTVIPAIMVGAQVFFLKNSTIFDWGRYLYEFKITYIDVVVTVLKYLALFVESSQNECSLKLISVNGEHLSLTEWERLNKAFSGASIYYSYGLSEAGPRVTCMNPLLFNSKNGSVGKPLEGIEIKIKEFDDIYSCDSVRQFCDSEVVIGEITVKSPSLMSGYLNNKDLTSKSIINGYLHTGDIGYIDLEGYLYVLGRKDSLIIKGGQNIYPYEIEDLLKKMTPIKECVVVGIPNTHYGNSLIAVIEKNCDVSKLELMKFCRKELPKHLIPDDFIFFNDFPKKNGKIIRNIIKQTLIEKYYT